MFGLVEKHRTLGMMVLQVSVMLVVLMAAGTLARPSDPYKPVHKPVSTFLVVMAVSVAMAMPSDPYKPVHKQEAIPYHFAYGVKDEYAGTDFGHSENSDGSNVKGSYNVQLPDGRKQTVLAFLVVVAVAGVHAKPSDSYKAVSSLLVVVAATAIIAKPSDPYQQPSYNVSTTTTVQ
ncbi:hypothetical protein Pmani_034356 [Petrolisthes manimaculis]|uniref:Uncharacterized protein n=1 Tax=Petrolisthes manimaculis TaxID=1843537 RepID=A0AAE1TRQ1_9EUCA|nr:hypothetical protein Pmani_034356 [Petrolisthes manimaculis]